MSNEANMEAARTYLKALGSGDVELFESVITQDFVAEIRGHSKISGTLGREQTVAFVRAVPQMTQSGIDFKILSLTADGDRVACESEGRTRLKTGVDYDNHYVHLLHFRDGKICRTKEYMDTQLAETALLPVMVLE